MVAVLAQTEFGTSPEQPTLFMLDKPSYTEFDVTRLRRLIRYMVLGDCLQWNGEQFIYDISDAAHPYYLLRSYRVDGKWSKNGSKRSIGGGWRKVWKATITPAKENDEESEQRFHKRLENAQAVLTLELVKRGWKAERVTWVCGQMPN